MWNNFWNFDQITIYSKHDQAKDGELKIYKSYTIELKHKETNTWYLVQEVNIQTDWFFITKIHISQKHKPSNYPDYATYEIKTSAKSAEINHVFLLNTKKYSKKISQTFIKNLHSKDQFTQCDFWQQLVAYSWYHILWMQKLHQSLSFESKKEGCH